MHGRPDGISPGVHGRWDFRRMGHHARRAEEAGFRYGVAGTWSAVPRESSDYRLSELSERLDGPSRKASGARRDGGPGRPESGLNFAQIRFPANYRAGRGPARRAADVSVDGRTR